jgi:fructose-1,6-bisphosphatase/inositol monophosphatase family enzyme
MTDVSLSFDDLLAIDALVRRVAKAEIMPRFGALSPDEISAKTTADDLVTVADVEAEKAITAGLRTLYPEAAVIGEETITAGFSFAKDALLFVIDPVDGTWNFANNMPVFGAMVSILSHGEEIGGVIHYPAQGDSLIVSKGQGVRRVDADGKLCPIVRRECVSEEPATGLIPFSLYSAEDRISLMAAFGHLTRLVTIQCSAYEYRLLVEGNADFCISRGLKPWDHSAGQLMLREIGGVGRMPNGEEWKAEVRKQDVLISAATPAVWSQVMASLKRQGLFS